jgi:hypothetical protein
MQPARAVCGAFERSVLSESTPAGVKKTRQNNKLERVLIRSEPKKVSQRNVAN